MNDPATPTDQIVIRWTLDDVMRELGMTRAGARGWLSKNRIAAIHVGNYRRDDPTVYDASQVRAARADQLRRRQARKTMGRWVR